MLALGLARLRAGAEQHLLQRRRRHHPRDPRRTMGQVGLGRDRPDLRRLGRPARRAHLRGRVHDRAGPVAGDLRPPRGRATPTRPSNRTPRTPTSSTTTGPPTREYSFLNLADETAAHRLAHPAGPTWRSPRRTSPTPAWPTSPRSRPARRPSSSARAGSSASRSAPNTATRRTSSTPPGPTWTSPPRTWRRRAGGGTTTPSSTRPPTPPSTPPRPPTAAPPRGPPTRPPSPPSPGSPTAQRHHPRARLQRLRLRRHH